jgi:hypothetical protein
MKDRSGFAEMPKSFTIYRSPSFKVIVNFIKNHKVENSDNDMSVSTRGEGYEF